MSLFVQPSSSSRTKVSVKRSRMGENPSAWETQATKELVNQHPWIASFRSRSIISKSDDQGYGIGYIEVTHKTMPAESKDSDRKIVVFPIFIDQYELAPFDVCYFAGRYMPTSKSRIETLLRSSTPLTVPTGEEAYDAYYINSLRNWNENANSSPYGLLSSVKFASVDSRRAVLSCIYDDIQAAAERIQREKVASWAAGIRGDAADEFEEAMQAKDRQWIRKFIPLQTEKTSETVKTSSAFTENFLASHASILGIEVRLGGDSYEHRTHWISDPHTGRAKTSSWRPAAFAEINGALPREDVSTLLSKGAVFVSDVADDASVFEPLKEAEKRAQEYAFKKEAQVLIDEAEQIFNQQELVPVGERFEKVSALKGNAVFTAVVSDGDTYVDKSFVSLFKELVQRNTYFRIVYCLDGYRSMRMEKCGFVFADGSALLIRDCSDLDRCCSYIYAEGKDSEVPVVPTRVIPTARPGDTDIGPPANDNIASGWFVDQDGTCVFFPGTDSHEVKVDGMTGYQQSSSAYDYGDQVILLSSMNRIMIQPNFGVEGKRAYTYIHLPETRAKYYEIAHSESDIATADSAFVTSLVQDSKSKASPSKEPGMRVAKAAKQSSITVEKAGDDQFEFTCTPPLPVDAASHAVLSRYQTKVSCAAAGLGPKSTEALLAIVENHGKKTIKVSQLDFDRGHRALRELDSDVIEVQEKVEEAFQKVSSVREGLVDASVKLFANMEFGHVKASKAFTSSIDGALSLGFLTRSNIVRIVDQLPLVEDMQGYLCTLLVASRLGLREIPEQETTEAIRGIEKIITGLKSLEYVIKFS